MSTLHIAIIPSIIGTVILSLCCALLRYSLYRRRCEPVVDDRNDLLPGQRRRFRVLVVRENVNIRPNNIRNPPRRPQGIANNAAAGAVAVQPPDYSVNPPSYDVATASAPPKVNLAGDAGIPTGTSHI